MYKTFMVKKFDGTEKDIADLIEILNGTGISVSFKKTDAEYGFLGIDIDEDKLKRFRTRNAGPGYKVSAKRISKYKLNPTYREVMEMRDTMENKEIIEKIGCSESAFYRQLRYRKKQLKDGSPYFRENDPFF